MYLKAEVESELSANLASRLVVASSTPSLLPAWSAQIFCNQDDNWCLACSCCRCGPAYISCCGQYAQHSRSPLQYHQHNGKKHTNKAEGLCHMLTARTMLTLLSAGKGQEQQHDKDKHLLVPFFPRLANTREQGPGMVTSRHSWQFVKGRTNHR